MRWGKQLLQDECGAVLSTELVLVGTLGVIGATVGLGAARDAIDAEFRDFARSIRSLDQSYSIEGVQGCSGWVAGSSFQQEPVEESLRRMEAEMEQADKQVEEARQQKIEEESRGRRMLDERRRELEERRREFDERRREVEQRIQEERRRMEERRRDAEQRESSPAKDGKDRARPDADKKSPRPEAGKKSSRPEVDKESSRRRSPPRERESREKDELQL